MDDFCNYARLTQGKARSERKKGQVSNGEGGPVPGSSNPNLVRVKKGHVARADTKPEEKTHVRSEGAWGTIGEVEISDEGMEPVP